MSKIKSMFRTLSLLLFVLFHCHPSQAANAAKTDIEGVPLRWDLSTGLIYNFEHGALKSSGAYDAAASQQIVRDAFATWSSLPGILLKMTEGVFLTDEGNVDGNNFSQFVPGNIQACYPKVFGPTDQPCLSPIIFDEDGSIVDSIFGACGRYSVLGFASFEDVGDQSANAELQRVVRRGEAVFSGNCVPPISPDPECGTCKRQLTDEEIRHVITHELGHMLGMDHSQLNPEAFVACRASKSGCPASFAAALPLMFPILLDGIQLEGLHRDDASFFQRLYGSSSEKVCSVSGKVFASDEITEVRGVEVVAKNVDPALTLTDAMSFVSGAEAPRYNNSQRKQGNCRENCGSYEIVGLQPGQTYLLCAQSIASEFTSSSSVGPVDPPFAAGATLCPEGLTVTCQCAKNGSCSNVTNQDIVTGIDPKKVEGFNAETPSSGGGCSLVQEAPTGFWSIYRKSLLRFL